MANDQLDASRLRQTLAVTRDKPVCSLCESMDTVFFRAASRNRLQWFLVRNCVSIGHRFYAAFEKSERGAPGSRVSYSFNLDRCFDNKAHILLQSRASEQEKESRKESFQTLTRSTGKLGAVCDSSRVTPKLT